MWATTSSARTPRSTCSRTGSPRILGKEAALWVPSGTMANQIALRLFTRPGDDVIVARESHALWHETGAAAANAGVQLTEVGEGGTFTAADFLAARKPRGHMLYPPTTLVQVEDTHNRAGGVVFPAADAVAICAAARDLGVASYLDGARLFNAAIAGDRTPAAVAAPFDLVSIALTKGLGAPGGSVLAGSRDVIDAAVRYRRMLGGAMRQVGILAAAGLYALDHNIDRLAEDHANARLIAARDRGEPEGHPRSGVGAHQHHRVPPGGRWPRCGRPSWRAPESWASWSWRSARARCAP